MDFTVILLVIYLISRCLFQNYKLGKLLSIVKLQLFLQTDYTNKLDIFLSIGSEIASFSKSLGTGTLAGLLQDSTNGSANLINAPKLAKDYSITLQVCANIVIY